MVLHWDTAAVVLSKAADIGSAIDMPDRPTKAVATERRAGEIWLVSAYCRSIVRSMAAEDYDSALHYVALMGQITDNR